MPYTNPSRLLKQFGLAMSFLTRIPVANLGKLEARDFGYAAVFYPVVGLFIGGCLWIIAAALSNTSALLSAAIIVVFWAGITGFLHLDGLADSADGWLGGLGDREKTKRIMKDPVVGTAGVVTLICLLLLKTTALVSLLEQNMIGFVIFAPILARTLVLLLFLTTPYVSSGGLASEIIEHLPQKIAIVWVVLVGICAIWLSLWAIIWVALGVWSLRHLMLQRLGGCTGDTIGALIEVSEMLWLLGIVLFLV